MKNNINNKISKNSSVSKSTDNDDGDKIVVHRSLVEVLQSFSRAKHKVKGRNNNKKITLCSGKHEKNDFTSCTLLSEEELIQIVNARPRNSLDVHRLINTIDNRFCFNNYNYNNSNKKIM